jgi:hypothetical protein
VSAALPVDEDLLRSPPIVRLAGASLGAVGFFVVGSAVQLAALYDGWLSALAIAPLVVLGLAALIVAPNVYNARGWAAIVGTAVALSLGVVVGAWAIWLVATLSFAPIVPLALGATWAAAALLPLAIRPAVRVTRARAALW